MVEMGLRLTLFDSIWLYHKRWAEVFWKSDCIAIQLCSGINTQRCAFEGEAKVS